MARRRRKKKDPFYKILFYVLIICGAFLVYEQIGKLDFSFRSSKQQLSAGSNIPLTSATSIPENASNKKPSLIPLANDKALEQIPQNAIKKGYSVYRASELYLKNSEGEKLILAYASGNNDNPDEGKPHLVVKSKADNNVKEISFEPIQKQLEVLLQGSPRLNNQHIVDNHGNQFYLVKTYVKDDVLQSVSVLIKNKEIAWAPLQEKNKKNSILASFLEGQSAATQTKVELFEKNNIPLLKVKRGILSLKQAKQTYEYHDEYYQWDGNKFVAMGH